MQGRGTLTAWHLRFIEPQTKSLGPNQVRVHSLHQRNFQGEKAPSPGPRLLGMGALVKVSGLGPRPAERQRLSPTSGAAAPAFFYVRSVALGESKISLNPHFPIYIVTSRGQGRPKGSPE